MFKEIGADDTVYFLFALSSFSNSSTISRMVSDAPGGKEIGL
jgi:hypothetical protein